MYMCIYIYLSLSQYMFPIHDWKSIRSWTISTNKSSRPATAVQPCPQVSIRMAARRVFPCASLPPRRLFCVSALTGTNGMLNAHRQKWIHWLTYIHYITFTFTCTSTFSFTFRYIYITYMHAYMHTSIQTCIYIIIYTCNYMCKFAYQNTRIVHQGGASWDFRVQFWANQDKFHIIPSVFSASYKNLYPLGTIDIFHGHELQYPRIIKGGNGKTPINLHFSGKFNDNH